MGSSLRANATVLVGGSERRVDPVSLKAEHARSMCFSMLSWRSVSVFGRMESLMNSMPPRTRSSAYFPSGDSSSKVQSCSSSRYSSNSIRHECKPLRRYAAL